MHREAWFPPCFVGPRIPRNLIFFFEKQKQSSRTQKLKNVQKYANISETPFNHLQPEVSNPSGSVVSTMFLVQNQPKKTSVRRFQTTAKQTLRELQKAALRISHLLSRCRVVFTTLPAATVSTATITTVTNITTVITFTITTVTFN